MLLLGILCKISANGNIESATASGSELKNGHTLFESVLKDKIERFFKVPTFFTVVDGHRCKNALPKFSSFMLVYYRFLYSNNQVYGR